MRTKVSPPGRVTFEEGRPVGAPVTLRAATKVYFLFRAPDGEVAPLSTRVDQEGRAGERARGWATGQLRLSGSRGVSLWTRVKPRSGLALEETRERDSELVSVELSLLNGLRVPVRLRVRSTGRELY